MDLFKYFRRSPERATQPSPSPVQASTVSPSFPPPREKRLPDPAEVQTRLETLRDELVKAPLKVLQGPNITRDIDGLESDSSFRQLFPNGLFRRMESVVQLGDGKPYVLITTHYHSKNWGAHEAFLAPARKTAEGTWEEAGEKLFCCYMGEGDRVLWYRDYDCVTDEPINDVAKPIFADLLQQAGQTLCP